MTKTYELKNATFTAEVGTPEQVRALTDEQITALVRNAMSNWSFRRGARKDSNRKFYDFVAVVTDMCAVGERSSGPTEADTKLADKLFFEAASLPRSASEEEKTAVLQRAIAKYRKSAPDFAFTLDDELSAHDNAAEFLAARRRDIARRSKSELV